MTHATGRLAVMTEPGQLIMAEYDVPEPERDALVLKIVRANVCGSELHMWNGHHPTKKRGGLGHELVEITHAQASKIIAYFRMRWVYEEALDP